MYFCMTMRIKGNVCLPAMQCTVNHFTTELPQTLVNNKMVSSDLVSNLNLFKNHIMAQW